MLITQRMNRQQVAVADSHEDLKTEDERKTERIKN